MTAREHDPQGDSNPTAPAEGERAREIVRLKTSVPAHLANAIWTSARNNAGAVGDSEARRAADCVLVAAIKAWPETVDEIAAALRAPQPSGNAALTILRRPIARLAAEPDPGSVANGYDWPYLLAVIDGAVQPSSLSPDDLARVASIRERVELADDGTAIYLHAEDCPSFCDYACNGNQHSGLRSPVLDELAWLLARLTPTTLER